MVWLRSARRFAALPWRLRWRLTEALLFLAMASVAVRWLPFRQVMRLAGGIPALGRGDADDPLSLIREVRWALQVWEGRVPWRAVCFQKGLAAHIMLRLRGIGSALHYGVRQSPEKGVEAHVWVTRGSDPVIGVEAAEGYACLASVPAAGR